MGSENPGKVTGGCLCEAIRYEVSFSGEGAWPPMISTCQCGMCRKWTGCLMSTDLVVKKSQVSPPFETFETFTSYQSTPGTQRTFCTRCGSGVAWFSENMPDDMIIFVGTIDEEYIMGKVVESTVQETEYGKKFERGPAYGKNFTDASIAGNLYTQNAIVGVTDNLSGPRFLQHFFDKVPLPQ